ncbi:MAG: DMT family transporter [bacterium]
MTLGLILSLVSGFLWSITNILDKTVVTKHLTNIGQLYVLVSIIHIIFGGTVLFFFQEPILIEHKLLMITAAIFWLVMGYTYFASAKIEEMSRVVPLFALVPVFVTIFGAIFLHEIFSFQVYLGIAIIVIGSLLIMFKQSLAALLRSRALGLMIISALSVAIYNILSKYLLEFYSFWTVYAWFTFFAGFLGLILFHRHIKSFNQTLKIKGWKGAWLYTLSETNSQIASVLFTLAVSVWFVSLASSVVTIQYLFVFLWTIILSKWKPNFLTEQVNRKIAAQKFIAIFLIISGIFLIA